MPKLCSKKFQIFI